MKIKYFTFFLILFSSCKDDIFDKRFRNENYVFYQEDGKNGTWIKTTPNVDIKLPKSTSTYFFSNGNKYAELKVIDSFPNRIIKFFDKVSNDLKYTTEYKSGTLINKTYQNGYYRDYHSNLGQLKSTGIIKNNLFEGKWKIYREDGETLQKIGTYKNGNLDGVVEDYWPNGNLQTKSRYVKGELNGKTFHYYENGKLEEAKFFKNGKIHGILIEYFGNGNLKSKWKYWLGKKIDTSKLYFENGNLKKLIIIKLDTISSRSTKQILDYYETGEFKSIFKSTDSTMTGKVKVYYKNGNISQEYNLINNVITNKIVSYYETGGVKIIGFLKNSKPDKYVQYFDKKGKLLKTMIVEKGIVIDSIIP